MAGEPRNITITREGQQFGPYAEDVARQFLDEGKLQATDLAWHPGADGWKPLSEVLAPALSQDAPPPPPPPTADSPPAESKPAEPPPDTKVHISRKGERHGPYTYATAKDYFASGQLMADDNCWHDGMDGWKPLGEVMGDEGDRGGNTCPECKTTLEAGAVFCTQCGFNLQTGQGTQSLPTGAGPQSAKPAGPATYSALAEEDLKQSQMMFVGIMMIVGCAFPLIFIGDNARIAFGIFRAFLGGGSFSSDSSIYFLNFQAIKDFESAVFLIGPLVVGIAMVAMAKTTRDPVRCSVAMGLCLFCLLVQLGGDSGGSNSPMDGKFFLFFLGWIGLIMGCRARDLRPANLPAYIIGLAGAGFLCLFWLIPAKGGGVPMVEVFKSFKGDKFSAITMLVVMAMQIGAAVICFVTTRTKPTGRVANQATLSIKLLVGSIFVAAGLVYLRIVYEALTADGGIGDKIGILVTLLVAGVKLLAWFVGLLLVLPLTGCDLLTRLMRR